MTTLSEQIEQLINDLQWENRHSDSEVHVTDIADGVATLVAELVSDAISDAPKVSPKSKFAVRESIASALGLNLDVYPMTH